MIVVSASVRPHEPCLVDSVGHVLVVSTPLAPAAPLPRLLRGGPGFAWCLTVRLCICSHQLLHDTSLMMAGLGTDLLSLEIILLISPPQSCLVLFWVSVLSSPWFLVMGAV